MKKHLILLKAMELYPFGTKFKSIAHNEECVSSGVFYFNEESESINSGLLTKVDNIGRYVYRKGIWAEIVNPKIAVKVDNEKEFNALMKYYDSLGWKWCGNHNALDYDPIGGKSSTKAIPFHDKFDNGIVSMKIEEGYTVIPFAEFAKERNIKLPLLKSKDDIWLYDGDEVFVVDTIKLKLTSWGRGNRHNFNLSQENTKNQNCELYFSTKKNALEWIEWHKPKKIILEFGAYKFTVTKDKVNVCYGDSDTDIDLGLINNALKELS